MLDSFLEVACEHEKKASAYQAMVRDMRQLPVEELQALASGRSKLASLFSSPCGDEDSWLSKFEGTPLHEQALELEQLSLEMDIAKEQRRLAEAEEEDSTRAVRDEEYRAEDAVRLKKRILDLELNKLKLEASTGASAGEGLALVAPEAPEELEEDDVEEEEPEEEPEGIEGGELEAAGEKPKAPSKPEEKKPEKPEEKKEPEKKPEEKKAPPADLKEAAARMRKAASCLAGVGREPTVQEKAAFLGALGAGAGALRAGLGTGGGLRAFGQKALGGMQQAYAKKGLGGALTAGGGFATRGAQQAGQWAAKNPSAALGVGLMGAGAGGLGAGYLAGR
jgi:hypothetical protein